MALILWQESQLPEVKNLWGSQASISLENILTEYDDLFMKHKSDICRCTTAKHPVEVEPGTVPHRDGARRMHLEKTKRSNQDVSNLLALVMIQPSLSQWGSYIVMVKMKNGELRFWCDFRPLNEVTVNDAYPLPRIHESLARLGKAKIYTSIDLTWVFWQIPVRKADRRKTAFACELGLFEWRRMPFGMCNVSAIFQRAIAIVKMRVAKCDFMKFEIKYLGCVVSAEGVKPDPKVIAKLRDWEVPRNITRGLQWNQKDSENEIVLDTDASAAAISGILHQWQGPPGDRRLRTIVYGSKKLTVAQANTSAPKLEMFAAYHFIIQNHSCLCPQKFTLWVDNQALSCLKNYSTDQARIGCWIMALDKYHFRVEHRPWTQPSAAILHFQRLVQANQWLQLARTTAVGTPARSLTLELPISRRVQTIAYCALVWRAGQGHTESPWSTLTLASCATHPS